MVPTRLCANSSDCYPAGLNGTNVPTKYINCSNQKCVCSDCFYATNSYKSCAYQRCWKYDKTTQTCNDLRKDQRTAFLLSLFLSALGAANFYVEQYTMGTCITVTVSCFGSHVFAIDNYNSDVYDEILEMCHFFPSHTAGFQLAILVLLPPLAIILLCCAALIIDRCVPCKSVLCVLLDRPFSKDTQTDLVSVRACVCICRPYSGVGT